MAKSLNGKVGSLRKKIRSMDGALVAISGGVDSAVLLRICREELGEKAIAVTLLSDDYPSEDLMMAKRIAKVVGVKHITVKKSSCGCESNNCKYKELRKIANKMKVQTVLNGSHSDDHDEDSYNLEAARREGAKSPMLECGLSKEDIRMLAKQFGLPNWKKKPSGRKRAPVAREKTKSMKEYLLELKSGFSSVSVRGRTLYVSAEPRALVKLSSLAGKIRRKARSIGLTKLVITLKA